MKKTNTPLTDEQVLAYRSEDGSEFVFASFAEELETKLASMKARAEKAEAELVAAKEDAEDQAKWALKYLRRAEKAEADAEKAEADLAHAREKVRVLREALERRHTEQSYHRQYVDDALAATEEASK